MSIRAKYLEDLTRHIADPRGETVMPLAPYVFYDDFDPATNGTSQMFAEVGGGVVSRVASADCGVVSLALAATEEKEEASLHFDDDVFLNFGRPRTAIEFRANIYVLPTALAEVSFGVVGPVSVNGIDAIGLSSYFHADGSGLVYCGMDDDGVIDSETSSGVTVVANTWHTYRIVVGTAANGDCVHRYFIDGSERASLIWTPGTATENVLQPYLNVYKVSGAGEGTLYVDYIRAWQERS